MGNITLIEDKVFVVRGTQIMIDFHLAELYQVQTRVLNQAVKRNLSRFPIEFRFQLTEEEWEDLKSQIVISSEHGGRRTIPFVFTEQGVSMLSAVLNSDVAIEVSIQIMNAFVQMRKMIGNNLSLLKLSNDFESYKLQTDTKFDNVFKALESREEEKKQGVFFNGQTYDAYDFVNNIIRKAKKSIYIVDNYIDDSVITQLTKKKKGVDVVLFTKKISNKLKLDIKKANLQYPKFKALEFSDSHDRFIIIDQKIVYHVGASLKDLGKKWFAFSKLESSTLTIISKINNVL